MARKSHFWEITCAKSDGEADYVFEDAVKDIRKNCDPHEHLYKVFECITASLTITSIDPAEEIVETLQQKLDEGAEVEEGRESITLIIIWRATYPSTVP
ncbi:hypothetical protein BWQ96_09731 [Gracilariopsis chorda]|uniref:Uncharacterized protein n=1 Tax=Gracilariopsis chorda TaxID=448386 RepID=A0A2V3IEQ9_9FLOR|nr:hypothetical protein BWQ96_09731 [Gracilariopsis chorda]|eukprot:PXF40557.1 hypothetical protein BWQ96_09731 [Gracilariopsis chorda]